MAPTPESLGVPSAAIHAFLDAVAGDEMHSFVLLRRGEVVAQGAWAPFTLERPHQMWSISKSFTSVAAGMAIAEGRFGLDDPVTGHFPEFCPAEVSGNLAAMTVRDLLTMATGHLTDPPHGIREQIPMDWRQGFLHHPVEAAPGSTFMYNTMATYMVSALIQRTTGQRLRDYLTPRLWEPLGLPTPDSLSCPAGIDAGGFGMFLPVTHLARFGELLRLGGVWEGRTLIPADYLAEATSSQIDNSPGRTGDWAQGYGFQFWRCQPAGVYRGDGAFGQYVVVMPGQEAVFAATAALHDMQAVLSAVWEHLLPAFADGPLSEDPESADALSARLGDPQIAPVASRSTPADPAAVVGTWRFLPTNGGPGSVSIGRDDEGSWTLAADDLPSIALGDGRWQIQTTPDGDVAATGGWTAPDRLEVRYRWLAWGSGQDLTLDFHGDRLTLERHARAVFQSPEPARVIAARNGA